MSLFVITKGTPQTKLIDGREQVVTPVSAESGHSMGVALLDKSHQGSFWGLVVPRQLIRSHRAMEIAQAVPSFEHGTLAACWYAGNEDVHSSDQRYVDEIEGKIGPKARREILTKVPENFEALLARLEERNVSFAGWEIEEEVSAGRIKKSPGVVAYLDAWQRRCEESRKAEFGVKIDPAAARKAIAESADSLQARFLAAFDAHVDPAHLTAIKHQTFGISQHFLSGRLRSDPTVEVTIRGGVIDGLMDFFSVLEIGLMRGEKLMKFEPSEATAKKVPAWLPGWAEKQLRAWGAFKEPELDRKFPYAFPTFGAVVRPEGVLSAPTFVTESSDPALRQYAEAIRSKVSELAAAV